MALFKSILSALSLLKHNKLSDFSNVDDTTDAYLIWTMSWLIVPE